MYVEYGTACAISASGVHNLGGGVGGVRKSGVCISPLPGSGRAIAGEVASGADRAMHRALGEPGRGRGRVHGD